MQKADSDGILQCCSDSIHADLHKLIEMASPVVELQYESEAVSFVLHCIGVNNDGLKA